MGFFKGRPGDQLGQTSRHEGEQDTAVDGSLGTYLIVIEAQFLLGIVLCFRRKWNFPLVELVG